MIAINMSLKNGNKAFSQGNYLQAIKEYEKYPHNHPLRKIIDFNVIMASRKINSCPKTRSLPTLTVVIPVFNVDNYVECAIISVLHQLWEGCQIIIVDDASTDKSAEKAKFLQALCPNKITIVELKVNSPGGCGYASNIGIDLATGKYLSFCDSDDILNVGALQAMVYKAEESNADLIIGDFKLIYEDKGICSSYDNERFDKVRGRLIRSSEEDFGEICRLSPVPWRKLYRTELLNQHNIRFPVVDHYFEDNPFHWQCLCNTNSVFVLDFNIAFHRMGRNGQTMLAAEHLLVNHLNNPYYVLSDIKTAGPHIQAQFCNWAKVQRHWKDRITDKKWRHIYEQRYAIMISDVVKSISPDTILQSLPIHPYHVSIIIPTLDCGEFLIPTIIELVRNDKVQVIVVDNGSTDGTVNSINTILPNQSNLVLLECSKPGAGRARNLGASFALGQYLYFLDADDSIKFESLLSCYETAHASNCDLLFFKYSINYYDQGRTSGMSKSDTLIYSKAKTASSQSSICDLALGLINYPWNRMIRSDFFRNNQILFGHTIVNNDIPFHWHSILASKNILFSDCTVCEHKKFDNRNQITNINGERRLQLFDSLLFTYEKSKRYFSQESLFAFRKFSVNMVDWCISNNLVDGFDRELANEQRALNDLFDSHMHDLDVKHQSRSDPITFLGPF